MKRVFRLSTKSIVIISSITAIIAMLVLIYFCFGVEGIGILCRILAILSAIAAYFLRIEEGCAVSLIPLFICALFATLSITLINYAEKNEKRLEAEALYEKIVNEPCISDCEKFINEYRKYSEAQKVNYVQKQWFELLLCNAKTYDYLSTNFDTDTTTFHIEPIGPLQELKTFANINKQNKYGEMAHNEIKIICDSLYSVANSREHIDIWRSYRKSVPIEYYRDSYEKIDEIKENIEKRNWGTESRAWKTALSRNTEFAYRKYMELYPNGAHIVQCRTKLIDIRVANVFAGQHGTLPPMSAVSYSNRSSSHISIKNSTGYKLTILYSGPNSKEVVIKKDHKAYVVLRNGTYKIAAFVDATGVRDYAGIENLNGSDYEVEYYIRSDKEIELPSIHF